MIEKVDFSKIIKEQLGQLVKKAVEAKPKITLQKEIFKSNLVKGRQIGPQLTLLTKTLGPEHCGPKTKVPDGGATLA